MNIYEQRNDRKREITCNYCRNSGHNKRHCPHLKAHYEAHKDFNPRTMMTSQLTTVTKEMFPDYYRSFWTDGDARRQFRAHFDYAKRTFGNTSSTRKRKKPSCGFCGSKSHNRRNCSELQRFVKVLNETNRAYREVFYNQIIDGLGLGIGSVVEVSDIDHMGRIDGVDQSQMCMVTSFDLDTVTLGNIFDRWNDYHTIFEIEMANKSFWSGRGVVWSELFESDDVLRHFQVSSWGQGITKVIAPAPSKPDKEWFLGQSPAFDWVVKKRSLKSLWDVYGTVIRRYHPKGMDLWEKYRKKIYGYA